MMIFKVLLLSLMVLQPSDKLAYTPEESTIIAAETYMEQGMHDKAAYLLETLLSDSILKPYLRLTIYWDLSVCYASLKNEKKALDYILRFVTYAYAAEDHLPKDFAEKTDLEGRVEFGEVLLNISHMKNNTNPNFGRTYESPFPLKSFKFFELIMKGLPFCKEGKFIFFTKKDISKHENEDIIALDVRCEPVCTEECKKPWNEVYYFERIPKKTKQQKEE